MPAGDAGLERRTVDTAYLAYLRQTVGIVGYLLPSHCEYLFTEIDRLQAQLAAQQAVVDAAREFVDDDPCRYDHNDYCQTHYGQRPCHMERLRAALDAAQPEGEHADE